MKTTLAEFLDNPSHFMRLAETESVRVLDEHGDTKIQLESGALLAAGHYSTEQEVEAVLLNSQAEPRREIQAALDAVAKFAEGECELEKHVFVGMAARAFDKAALL